MSFVKQFTVALFFLAVLTFLVVPGVSAQQLESASFIISNDELISGLLEGESASFNLIGRDSPLSGYLESDSFISSPIILGEAPTPTPTPTPTSAPGPAASPTPGPAVATPTPTPTPTPGLITRFLRRLLPSQLFDISLELDSRVITDINQLVARVIFTSFGTEPTPVDMTFTIINSIGEVVYQEKDSITVETEAVFTKKFEDLTLPLGEYTLVLRTLYNVDVEDQFSQDFIIGKEEEAFSLLKSVWFWLLVSVAFVIIIVLTKAKRTQRIKKIKTIAK